MRPRKQDRCDHCEKKAVQQRCATHAITKTPKKRIVWTMTSTHGMGEWFPTRRQCREAARYWNIERPNIRRATLDERKP